MAALVDFTVAVDTKSLVCVVMVTGIGTTTPSIGTVFVSVVTGVGVY